MSRESDLGWAAGVLDGEGCILLYKATTRTGTAYVLRVCVVNTSLLMLRRLQEIFGTGNIVVHAKATERHRPRWMWEVTTKKAEAVLKLIEPYLVNKREEAQLALYSRSLIGRHGVNAPNLNVIELEQIKRQLSDLKTRPA